MNSREVTRIVHGQATSDGAGVRLTRVIGSGQLEQLDPFLLLDEFRSDDPGDYIAGFPDHPHRGFETVTYMLAGRMRHRDNQGNEGLLKAGSIQWMTAGRGIVHSEMPEQEDGLMWGFQLWVNLPADQKMKAPRYQDIEPGAVPVVSDEDGNTVRILAGDYLGTGGPIEGIPTEPLYLDIELAGGTQDFSIPIPHGHNAFAYVFEGSMLAGDRAQPVNRGELALLGDGDTLKSAAQTPARFILVAARPLHEPVARYGPFVMNTQDEIQQAFEDFRSGRFQG